MNWRRAATRYGQTPAPATPYQRAEQLWDERIGAARVQAANWRLMAFGALALAAVAMGDDIRARSRSIVTPYVVEVDRTGAANAIAPASARVGLRLGDQVSARPPKALVRLILRVRRAGRSNFAGSR